MEFVLLGGAKSLDECGTTGSSSVVRSVLSDLGIKASSADIKRLMKVIVERVVAPVMREGFDKDGTWWINLEMDVEEEQDGLLAAPASVQDVSLAQQIAQGLADTVAPSEEVDQDVNCWQMLEDTQKRVTELEEELFREKMAAGVGTSGDLGMLDLFDELNN